jgi:VanZ family protein
LVIFLFSSHPTKVTSEVFWQDFVIKKTAHIVEYAIFSLLLYRALVAEGMERKKAGIISVFFAFIYGASDEYHQSFVSGRQPKFRDVIFDTIGGILSIFSIWKLLPKAPKRLKSWAAKLQIS